MASMYIERRVVLVGKTGNGKSSTGNAILGVKKFKADNALNAVTSICSVETSQRLNGRPIYKICDTPGFYDADCNEVERSLEVIRSVTEFCPNPHVFLLVFSSADRISEEDNCTIDLLRVIFGENMFDHCILVFTRGEEFDDDEEFENFWNEDPLFVTLAEKCGNRVVRIENNPKNKESGLHNLLTTIEKVCNNGSKMYENEEIHKHVKAMTGAIEQFDKKTERWRNHANKEDTLEYKTEKTEKIMAFLRYMDITLSKTLLSWNTGIAIATGLLKLGVGGAVAIGAGIGGAVVVGAVAVGAGIILASQKRKQNAALEHHKQD